MDVNARLRAKWSRLVTGSVGIGVALVALDLILAAACVLCLRQNTDLRSQLAKVISAVTPGKGSLAPPLIGEDQYGKQDVLAFHQDTRPTVIFTFSDECLYCRDYWKAIRTLQPFAPGKLRLAYIDTEETPKPDYLSAHGAAAEPVLTKLIPESALAYRALVLPQVEVLDGSGRVQWSYAGQITPSGLNSLLTAVEQQFQTK